MGALDVAELPLLLLADVEQDGAIADPAPGLGCPSVRLALVTTGKISRYPGGYTSIGQVAHNQGNACRQATRSYP